MTVFIIYGVVAEVMLWICNPLQSQLISRFQVSSTHKESTRTFTCYFKSESPQTFLEEIRPLRRKSDRYIVSSLKWKQELVLFTIRKMVYM